MDTLQLKLFISLSKTLNFTKTANEFYVTQPTVSNYLKSLESSMGVTLLKRDSHSVSLTPEGKEFLGYATQILALQNEAEERLHNISGGRRGYIRIAMLSSAVDVFPGCLELFNRRYPGVQVNVDILEGGEMINALNNCSYDLYFAHEHMVSSESKIDYFAYNTSNLHLFYHRSIADQIEMSDWSTLEKFHFVSSTEAGFSLYGQVKRICTNRGIVPDIINFYNRADAVLLAIDSGVGVAVLPPQLKNLYNLPDVEAAPIPGTDTLVNCIVAWNRGTTNPEVQHFISLPMLSEKRIK